VALYDAYYVDFLHNECGGFRGLGSTMPMTSLYLDIPPSQLKHLAMQMQKWMQKTGATYDQFLARYSEVKSRLDPLGITAPMNRWRLLSFLNLARGSSAIRVARALRCREAEIIATVIGVPLEVLLGLEYEPTYRLLNISESDADIDSAIQIIGNFQDGTCEMITWAEVLPLAVAIPHTIQKSSRRNVRRLVGVAALEKLGSIWRDRFLGTTHGWKWTHLMFLSDLRKCSSGERGLEGRSNRVREEHYKQTIRRLDRLGIQLLVADDEHNQAARALKYDMQDYCYVTTWDERLVQLIGRHGTCFSSDRPRHTKYWRGMLEEFVCLTTDTKWGRKADLRAIARDDLHFGPGIQERPKLALHRH
jgi:hypothetical protein